VSIMCCRCLAGDNRNGLGSVVCLPGICELLSIFGGVGLLSGVGDGDSVLC